MVLQIHIQSIYYLPVRWETPLYVQSHTGAVLWDSIERDSSFLAAHDVMDYSLLLGLHGNTLVLGIIGQLYLSNTRTHSLSMQSLTQQAVIHSACSHSHIMQSLSKKAVSLVTVLLSSTITVPDRPHKCYPFNFNDLFIESLSIV